MGFLKQSVAMVALTIATIVSLEVATSYASNRTSRLIPKRPTCCTIKKTR